MIDLNKLIRPNIKALRPYSSARDEYSKAAGVFLDANENPYGSLNRYPDPYQKALKETISTLRSIEPKNIFLGNGSDEIIDLLYRIFCEPGIDKAMIFPPTYSMYKVSSEINNVNLVEVPLTPEFQLDIKTVMELRKTEVKLAFLCSPNNPTGNTLFTEDVELLLRNFMGIVVIDEAYIEFSHKESWLKRIHEFPNLVVLQTFSKAYALAAARIGVAYASQEIISLLNKVKPPYNISTPNQVAGIKALAIKKKTERYIKTINEEKEKMIARLKVLDLVLEIYPSDTNFLLIVVKDANKVYKQLIRQKIIVRNRNSVVSNTIRITIGTPDENKKLLKALKTITL